MCFGALIFLLLFILGDGLTGLLFACPFLLCGVICLYTHQRTGLWCAWAVFLCVDLYLRYATGITWTIILYTLQFTPEMNYLRLAFGWGLFLVAILLIVLTVRSYRKKTAVCDMQHIMFAFIDLALLIGLTFLEHGTIRYLFSLSYEIRRDIWYFWIRSCGDFIRLALLVTLLVKSMALIRLWRQNRSL